jgi:hypothetical protein
MLYFRFWSVCGDSDWYFYDAKEFGAGVNLLFTF